MAVNSSEECQNVHSIVVVLPDRGETNMQYEPASNICQVKVPNVIKTESCLVSEPDLLNPTHLKVDKFNRSTHCSSDGDLEKGNLEIPKCTEESTGYFKSDHFLARVICLRLGGKFMQFLMNRSLELLPKVSSKERTSAGRIHDRSRKCRRSTSFNSRRIVLLFSVMSSIGTIILIYLTLRVRPIVDGSSNI